MRFIHTSDLHIGKTVNGFSMLEEQIHALDQIVETAVEQRVDAVFLCGDLYDRSVPAAVAVTVLDGFLTRLVENGITVLAIAGNHDCGERIGFAGRILEKKGLYMVGSVEEEVRFADFGTGRDKVRVHMLPFAVPARIRDVFGGEADTYEEGMRQILAHVRYLEDGANILLAHQFVVNQGIEPKVCESETRSSVGGADQVDASNFRTFDYTALGHLHGCQQIGEGAVYYSGSPVKYSFSEAEQEKQILVGEVNGAGLVSLKGVRLTPVHDMRKIKGKLSDLIREDVAALADPEDYILAVLTNEEELVDPIGTLRSVYPNVMQLQLEQRQGNTNIVEEYSWSLREKTPLELFQDFFLLVTGKELSGEQEELVLNAVDQAGKELG